MESSPKKLANAPRGSHPGFWKKTSNKNFVSQKETGFCKDNNGHQKENT
jgi:hypothetical protein